MSEIKKQIKEIFNLNDEKIYKDVLKVVINDTYVNICNKQIYEWVNKDIYFVGDWFSYIKTIYRGKRERAINEMEEKITDLIFKDSDFSNYKFRWILVEEYGPEFQFWFEDIKKPGVEILADELKVIILGKYKKEDVWKK